MSLISLSHCSQSAAATAPPHGRVTDRTPQRISHRDLVARVTTFVRDNIREPVTVAELSRMAGVSERTLRAAFHDTVGLSPKRYAIAQRLQAARTALATATPGTTTVTDVAMTYGFFELGRFAGRYRSAFGEVPSQTLQHATTASRPEQAA
jgi:transcriptional regulator GlxA family with amidase domain